MEATQPTREQLLETTKQIWRDHVYSNLGQLIDRLSQLEDEDLSDLMTQDDWESAAKEAKWQVYEVESGYVLIQHYRQNYKVVYSPFYQMTDDLDEILESFEVEPIANWDDKAEVETKLNALGDRYICDEVDQDLWREVCKADSIRPHQIEALEHYSVSEWLADKLKNHDEMIGSIYGLSVWGRSATGQAVWMDECFLAIAREMSSLNSPER